MGFLGFFCEYGIYEIFQDFFRIFPDFFRMILKNNNLLTFSWCECLFLGVLGMLANLSKYLLNLFYLMIINLILSLYRKSNKMSGPQAGHVDSVFYSMIIISCFHYTGNQTKCQVHRQVMLTVCSRRGVRSQNIKSSYRSPQHSCVW